MRYIKIALVFIVVLTIFCTYDQGIVSPSDENSITPLAKFQGYVINEGDTTISASRILKIQNPKIAILWQFLGFTRFTSDLTISATETQLPFNFTGSLHQPPPPQVYTSNEVAIGMLILYSDVNNNGKFDRQIHPELKKAWLYLDSLSKKFDSLRNELEKISLVSPEAIDWNDTFSVYYDNSIIQYSEGRTDTITSSIPWTPYIYRRIDILRNDRKWDYFFANRKRFQPIDYTQQHLTGFYSHFEFSYKRRLFPQQGKETEFGQRLEQTVNALYFLTKESDKTTRTAYINGWLDYPYNGVDEPGQDWIAGRTKLHHIFYFPDQKSIQELLDAERYSSFSINHKERLKPGYNLMLSDDQYRCDVLSWNDSIMIYLGMNELYFNPITPLKNPVSAMLPITLNESYLKQAEGYYEYMPFKPLMLHACNGSLWADIPDVGICKLSAADSLHYFSIPENIQLEIVRYNSKTEKVFVYRDGERYVGTPGVSDSLYEAFKKNAEVLAYRKPSEIDTSIVSAYNGLYEFGASTLEIQSHYDHLQITFSPKYTEDYFPLNDSMFFTESSDQVIEFKKNNLGKVYGLKLIRGNTVVSAPALDYIPRLANEISNSLPVAMNTILDSNGGSGIDTLCTLIDSCRYQPTADGRFLQEGDGALISFVRGAHDDAISFFGPDNYMVFRLNDLEGKTVGFELNFIVQREIKQDYRVYLYVQGGPSITECDQKLIDDQYFSLHRDSSTKVIVNPIVITSNPYFIKVGYSRTGILPAGIAVDSYRIGAE